MSKSIILGIVLTLLTAGLLVFLIIFAEHFYLKLVLGTIIAFQLSFIWTCAELLDGPDEELGKDEPSGRDFTH